MLPNIALTRAKLHILSTALTEGTKRLFGSRVVRHNTLWERSIWIPSASTLSWSKNIHSIILLIKKKKNFPDTSSQLKGVNISETFIFAVTDTRK